MTPRQKELVQASFEQLTPIAETAAAMFYGRLFELNPKLERLFKGDREEQGRKLLQMIGVAVKGLNRLNELIPLLRELGRRHTNYGVAEQDYETVGMALLWTLEHGLGAAFTAELRDAWVAVYKLIATTMQEGARESLVVIVPRPEPTTCSGGRMGWRGYFPAAASRTSNQSEPESGEYETITGRFASTLVTLVLALFLFTATAQANTYKVTTTADNVQNPPAGSLRKAIVDANNHLGADVIIFEIPGAGVHTITPVYDLPPISEQLKIDGYSQLGASENTQATGSNAVLLIELNGSSTGVNGTGLYINAPNCEITGLIINRFSSIGIHVNGPLAQGFATITGCFIGTNPAGNAAAPNGIGVFVYAAEDTTVGGLPLSARNLISGNTEEGVHVGHYTSDVDIIGNLIGTDKSGTGAIPNGIGVSAPSVKIGNIGGTLDVRENVISGNKVAGVSIIQSEQVLVRSNRIGTNAQGTTKVPNGQGVQIDSSTQSQIGPSNVISGNGQSGILIKGTASKNKVNFNLIGTELSGTSALSNGLAGISLTDTASNNVFENNTIAFNPRGFVSSAGTGNTLKENSIFSNVSVGIDLMGALGFDTNDLDDADAGPNNLQNYPVIDSAVNSGSVFTVTGTLNSEDNKSYTIDFFASPQCDSSGYGEGKTYLQTLSGVKTIGHNAAFSKNLQLVPVGQFITATVTDADGNTSEFSQCRQVIAPGQAGTLAFISAAYSSSESGQAATVTVARTGSSSGVVSVQYQTGGGTATANSCYSPASGTLVWNDGDAANKTFTIPIVDDQTYETDETVNLSLSNAVGGAVLGNQKTAVLTITNDDSQPGISINNVSQAEGNSGSKPLPFTVTLSNPSYQQITVNYATTAGTATDGTDYQSASGTLTFNPGETAKPIAVSVNGDSVFEPDETFFVQLSNLANASIINAQGTGTITNDEASQSGSFNFNAASYSVNENGVNATVTVKRSGGSDGAVAVQYATSDGTATANSDYTNASGTLSWADGDSADKTFTITIANDGTDELDETVNVTLSNPTGGASLGNPSSAVLTITDDDAQPAISISDVSQAEGNSGMTNFSFDVTLSVASGQTVTVDYLAADGTALVGGDYQAASGTLTFAPGETTKSLSVVVNGDTQDEPTETFVVNLSNPSSATIAKGQGTGTVVNDDAAGGASIQFTQATYAVAEQLGAMTVTVTRSGNVSNAASVDYATGDGSAAQKTDFEYAAGTLNFSPGEVSKTFVVLLNQDSYNEGPESFNLLLSNPAGAALGAQTVSQVSITDDLPETVSNPIDDAETFVYMHYHDFLNREPDAAGLAFWTNEIGSCGNDAQCIDARRINVSAAFFLSIEFQETGYLSYLMQKESFGSTPKYAEFMRDVQEVSRGVVVKAPGWEQKLKDNQLQFAENWIARPEFKAVYDGLSNDAYVNALYTNAGIVASPAQKDKLVTALNGASMNRATVLLDVANDATFRQQERNAAFVMMEYFGYLRRDPNAAPDSDLSGYNFWLNKLNQFGGNHIDAEMIKAFITSFEYRQRFAQ